MLQTASGSESNSMLRCVHQFLMRQQRCGLFHKCMQHIMKYEFTESAKRNNAATFTCVKVTTVYLATH